MSSIKELEPLLETLIVPRFLCHAFLRYRPEHPKLTQDVDDVNLFLELLVPMDQKTLSALGSQALTEALMGHSRLYIYQQRPQRVPLNIILPF